MSAPKIALDRAIYGVALVGLLLASCSNASEPEAARRSYMDNFRDMVLARCIARAYQTEVTTSADARSSANVLMEWTRYDAEAATDAVPKLIEKYLARDYSNPLQEYRGRQFSFLKCTDLYHSEDLKNLAKQLVSGEPVRK
jgi:hypothetical protein